jgi:hypothetical protein
MTDDLANQGGGGIQSAATERGPSKYFACYAVFLRILLSFRPSFELRSSAERGQMAMTQRSGFSGYRTLPSGAA